MSTVDAAIINYITNGGGSSGGGGGGSSGGGETGGGGSSDVAQRLVNNGAVLSIPDATSLTFTSANRGAKVTINHADQVGVPLSINADYGSTYPSLNVESPNFTLTATKHGQTGKSLTTLKSADFYTEGNLTVKEGFAFSAPNIYTKQEVDTMFATGGNADVDTMTRLGYRAGYATSTKPSGGEWIGIEIPQKKYVKTGLIVKIYNNRSSEIESYVVIRKSDKKDIDLDSITDSTESNAILVSLTSDRVVPAYIGMMDSHNMSPAIAFVVSLNTYDLPSESTDTGVFEINHMSHSTLVKIVMNYHTTYDQSV